MVAVSPMCCCVARLSRSLPDGWPRALARGHPFLWGFRCAGGGPPGMIHSTSRTTPPASSAREPPSSHQSIFLRMRVCGTAVSGSGPGDICTGEAEGWVTGVFIDGVGID